MKLKLKLSILLLFVVISSLTGEEKKQKFNFKREIFGINSYWHKLVLPDDIYDKISQDLSDLRIIGVTTKGDTIEAPYILKTFEDKTITEEVSFSIINESQSDRGSFYTFETSTSGAINQIDLNFIEDNFDWQINLEGSHNQEEWFTILVDYRILSIKNGFTDFSYTKLNFPESKYKFYRLFVKSNEKPELTKASLQQKKDVSYILHECPVKTINIKDSKEYQSTSIMLELEQFLPINYIKIEVNDNFDFYRPLSILYEYDSYHTTHTIINKDSIRTFEKKCRGKLIPPRSMTLNSSEDMEFNFETIVANNFLITIENGNNQPLNIGAIEVKGYRYEMIVRFTEPAKYYLFYNPLELKYQSSCRYKFKLTPPNYDITNFQDKIPENLSELSLGEEEVVENNIKKKTALFKNKLWLWGVMILMILLLGFVSVRLIREG